MNQGELAILFFSAFLVILVFGGRKWSLERAIFNLPQIRFATIDNIPDLISLDPNEILQLNNFDLQLVFV